MRSIGSTIRSRSTRRFSQRRLRQSSAAIHEMLEQRMLLSIPTTIPPAGTPVSPPPVDNVPHSKPVNGTNALDVVLNHPTIAPIKWKGQDTFGKKGQWVAQFAKFNCPPDAQVQAVQNFLTHAGLKWSAKRYLGDNGLLLLEAPADLTYDAICASLA